MARIESRSKVRPITNLVESAKSDGITSVFGPHDPRRMMTMHESLPAVIYEREGKPERMTIDAIIIEGIVDTAFNQRDEYPPLGLISLSYESWSNIPNIIPVEQFPPENTFDFLRKAFSSTLALAKDQEIDRLKDEFSKNPKSIPGQLIDRFEAWIEVQEHFKLSTNTLYSGIGTATSIMSGILEAIAILYAKNNPNSIPNIPELVKIAQNSYQLVSSLAMLDINSISFLQNTLLNDRPDGNIFNPNSFELQRPPNGKTRLALTQQTVNQVHSLVKKNDYESFRTGCPAMAVDAVKKLWDWHLEAAPQVYEAWFSSQARN